MATGLGPTVFATHLERIGFCCIASPTRLANSSFRIAGVLVVVGQKLGHELGAFDIRLGHPRLRLVVCGDPLTS